MNKHTSIFRLLVAFCAILFAATLCYARETARGIVAEDIGDMQNDTELSEPKLRFVEMIPEGYVAAISSDFKFFVYSVEYYQYYSEKDVQTYFIVDSTTGYVLRFINIYHEDIHLKGQRVGISVDNNYIKILYDNEEHTYSAKDGSEVFNINQKFIYFTKDEKNEIPPFADNEELFELYKSHRWLKDDENKLYIKLIGDDSGFFVLKVIDVIDAVTQKKYEFSFHEAKQSIGFTYLDKYKGFDAMTLAVAYGDGKIIRYSITGEKLATYDFEVDAYIHELKQQENYLIAYSDETICVYDLSSDKLVKQYSFDYFVDIDYLNFYDDYYINIEHIFKYDLKTDNYDPPKDYNYNGDIYIFGASMRIDDKIYFLAYDKYDEIIVKQWDSVKNEIENSIRTGIHWPHTVNWRNFDFRYKDNMLYVIIRYGQGEGENTYVLKCDFNENKCFVYQPQKEYYYADFLHNDDFDTVILSTSDNSRHEIVNLKDLTLLNSLNFEKDEDIRFFADEKKYLRVFSTQNTVQIYDCLGRLISQYANKEEYRKSQYYRPFCFMTPTGVTVSDFYGELYHIQFTGDGESMIYTPEGFFCGSEWATQNLVYIVDGMEVIGIDQVYDMLYRPDLVAAKIRGEDISPYVVSLSSLVRSGSAPIVAISGVPAESSERDITLTVSVRNMGGGIGAVNLLLNGKFIRISDGVSSADGETVSFRHTVTLQNGSNTLEAFALNGAGLVESVRSSAQVAWKGATEKPDLYVLTVAINRYRDKSLWLNYAVPDAEAVAIGFQKQESGLYRNVHVAKLTDANVTKEGLSAKFSHLSERVRADDVFVFYISGHGTTYDDGDYYYLPYDFRYTSKDSIPGGGISKKDLTDNLSKIKAGKTLVMLDTCNSGAFLSDVGKRGLSEKTAIDRLTRATGHATLAASSDAQAAMEGYNGHGVFTYVLLEGIAGAADSNNDGYVTLNELSAFVEREVPARSYEKWGYEQIPQKDLRRQDFPITGK